MEQRVAACAAVPWNPDAGPPPPVSRFVALPLVARWMLVCVVLPAASWVVMVVIGTVPEVLSSRPLLDVLEELTTGLGFLFIIPVYTAVPGAVVGAAVGSADLALGRFVERSPQRPRAARVASSAMGAVLILVSLILNRVLFSGESVPVWVGMSAACAAVPAAICWHRYRRIAASGASAPGAEHTA